jgi:hypothetical protein
MSCCSTVVGVTTAVGPVVVALLRSMVAVRTSDRAGAGIGAGHGTGTGLGVGVWFGAGAGVRVGDGFVARVVVVESRAGVKVGIGTGVEVGIGTGARTGVCAAVETGAGVGVGAGMVVSESKPAIGSVVIWVGMVVSQACTARLNSSAFSCINSRTVVPVLPCRFRIFWRAISISVRL